jgi:DNA-directed RNA polymerase specialized sigma24 family protein
MSPAEAFAQHQAALLRVAGMWFGPHVAEEAVSVMWIKAVEKWDTYRGTSSRYTWLSTILRNEWRSEHRKVRVREKINHQLIEGIDVAVRPGFDDALTGNDRLKAELSRMSARDLGYLIEWAEREDKSATERGQQAPATPIEKIHWFRAIRKAREVAARIPFPSGPSALR